MTSAKEMVGQSVQFLNEVWAELKRVVWPSWNETRVATLVVVVAVFFVATFLGLVDFALSQVVDRLLTQRLR